MGFRAPAPSQGIPAGLQGEAESRGVRTQAVAATFPSGAPAAPQGAREEG